MGTSKKIAGRHIRSGTFASQKLWPLRQPRMCGSTKTFGCTMPPTAFSLEATAIRRLRNRENSVRGNWPDLHRRSATMMRLKYWATFIDVGSFCHCSPNTHSGVIFGVGPVGRSRRYSMKANSSWSDRMTAVIRNSTTATRSGGRGTLTTKVKEESREARGTRSGQSTPSA